jgi:hypothetical protein
MKSRVAATIAPVRIRFLASEYSSLSCSSGWEKACHAFLFFLRIKLVSATVVLLSSIIWSALAITWASPQSKQVPRASPNVK